MAKVLTMPEKTISEVSRAWRDLFEKGSAALARQNYDYAIDIFNQILHKEPAFYDCRESLRAAQYKRAAGAGQGFFKKAFGKASFGPLLAKGQIVARSRQIVIERLGGHAEGSVGDNRIRSGFRRARPHFAGFIIAAQVKEQMAEMK